MRPHAGAQQNENLISQRRSHDDRHYRTPGDHSPGPPAHPTERRREFARRAASSTRTACSATSVHFVFVALEEPHKSDVLAFRPGDAMDRRARVLLLNRATGQGSDLVVSVTEGRVVSEVTIDSTRDGHVPILDQEFEDIDVPARLPRMDRGHDQAQAESD